MAVVIHGVWRTVSTTFIFYYYYYEFLIAIKTQENADLLNQIRYYTFFAITSFRLNTSNTFY